MSNALTSTDVTAISAAVVAVLTAIGGLITVVAGLIPAIRRQKDTAATVAATHAIVNGQQTATLAYQGQLVHALTDAGTPIPTPPAGLPTTAPVATPVSSPADTASLDEGPVG